MHCYQCPVATDPQAKDGLPNLLLGFAPDEAYPAIAVASYAVGFYPTISPLPENRRYIFCGAFYSVTAPGCYPASCPMEPGLSSSGLSAARDHLACLEKPRANHRIHCYQRNWPSQNPRYQRLRYVSGTVPRHLRHPHNRGYGCSRDRNQSVSQSEHH